jgi:hypothetical protein
MLAGLSLLCSLFFHTVVRAQEVNSPYLSPIAETPCATNKKSFEANEKLKAAFNNIDHPIDPFKKRNWPGQKSDMVINENGAIVYVHEEYAFAASLVGAEVSPVPIFQACYDSNNKPYFFIGNSTKAAKRIYLDSKQVALANSLGSDTFTLVNPENPPLVAAVYGPGANNTMTPVNPMTGSAPSQIPRISGPTEGNVALAPRAADITEAPRPPSQMPPTQVAPARPSIR